MRPPQRQEKLPTHQATEVHEATNDGTFTVPLECGLWTLREEEDAAQEDGPQCLSFTRHLPGQAEESSLC